jgi:heat shock protein HslJ
MKSRARSLAVVAMVVSLAGCGSGQSSSPSSPSGASSPIGRTWTLASLDGHSLVAGSTITAEFTSESRVAGSSGCNRYSGSAQADAGRLSVGLLASTLMACAPDGMMAQETRYLAALQAATRYTVTSFELRLGTSATDASIVFTAR